MKRLQKKWLGAIGLVLPLTLFLASCGQGNDKDKNEGDDTSQPEISSPQYVIPDQTQLVTPTASLIDLDVSTWAIKPPFYAAGQEPFWRLELNDGWFVFQRLGLPEIEAQVEALAKVNSSDVFILESMTITITSGACSNAQANEPVLGDVTVEHNEVMYQGCVYQGKTQTADLALDSEDGVVSNWTKEIGIYVIESDFCFEALEKISAGASKKAIISAMQSRSNGLTAFVLETAQGNEFVCVAKGTGGVESIEPLEKSNRQDWMKSSGRFMRVESGPPPRACLDAEPVMVDNQLTGYLLPRKCRP